MAKSARPMPKKGVSKPTNIVKLKPAKTGIKKGKK